MKALPYGMLGRSYGMWARSKNRIANSIELNIYRRPTYIDITIHFTSNHPFDQKLAAFTFYINRMTTVPITEQAKNRNGTR